MGPTVKLKARRGHQRRRESLGHSCRFRIKSSLFAKQRIGTVARRCFDQISPDSERCHQKSLLRSAAFSRRDPERGLQTRLSARSSGSVESPRSGGGSNSELSHVRPRKGNQPSLAGRYFVCGHAYACGGRTQTPKHPPSQTRPQDRCDKCFSSFCCRMGRLLCRESGSGCSHHFGIEENRPIDHRSLT
jgi:hypothetical protein